jgi:hypothetical protein
VRGSEGNQVRNIQLLVLGKSSMFASAHPLRSVRGSAQQIEGAHF